ncbi:hypothetical protein MBM_08129 [Drepanopeziza brunnea f. sp. 'multigermtubi' MB_m1]|uniref:2EXR domain-containing protein n=1 Tax=Marssonina brunnea f. sp. multigermtubi (strain MB_m1) TaxID=1072389 RepID=K1WZ63_MARBU|nr:uncharacterized protein MBM_08129 [Drepanopeziza brunnea f. sp. 'multigermtubi' MB_m1]EKD13928.1 hypothetical protein MBM_08129 [Drepanopeziza brunnea f. sp. 'multigermtubi' MB_m1]
MRTTKTLSRSAFFLSLPPSFNLNHNLNLLPHSRPQHSSSPLPHNCSHTYTHTHKQLNQSTNRTFVQLNSDNKPSLEHPTQINSDNTPRHSIDICSSHTQLKSTPTTHQDTMSVNLSAGGAFPAELKMRARCQVPIHKHLHYEPSAHMISVSAATNTAARTCVIMVEAPVQPEPVAYLHPRAPATVQPEPVAQSWDTYVPFSDQQMKLAPATARPEPVAQTWDTYVPFSDQYKPAPQSLDVRAPATVQPEPVAQVLAPVTVQPKRWDYDEGRQWANLNLRIPRSQLAYAKSIEPFIVDNRLADIPYELLINKPESDGEVGAIFEFFPILPGELRNKIWGYAVINQLKGDRTIRIEILYNGFDGNIPRTPRIVNRSAPIPLLNTSRDARAIAMPFYEKTFTTDVPNPNYILFNHENDRVFVNTPGNFDFVLFIRSLPLDQLPRIRHMAITVKELQRHKYPSRNPRNGGVVGLISDYFPGLKTLTMIAGDARIDGPYVRKVTRHSVRAEFKRYQLGWDPSLQHVPEVNGDLLPALLARRWGVDDLPW